MSNPFFDPGPTPGTVINSPGELDALVADAAPLGAHGMTYRSASAPDISTYPIYANFIWIDTSGPTNVKRTYNTSLFSWDPELPAAGSITGDMIANDTIPIAKLHAPTGVRGYVVRVSTVADTFILDDPLNLYGANEFPVAYLQYSSVGKFVLGSTGAANAWGTTNSYTDDNSLDLSKLKTAGGAQYKVTGWVGTGPGALAYDFVYNFINTNTLPINKLELGAPNSFVGTNGVGDTVVYFTLSQLATLLSGNFTGSMQNSGNQAIPAVAGLITFPHGLAAMPKNLRTVLVCTTGDAGYAVGDEVDAHCFTTTTGANSAWWVSIFADTTNIYARFNSTLGNTILIPHKTTGLETLITVADWRMKFYYAL